MKKVIFIFFLIVTAETGIYSQNDDSVRWNFKTGINGVVSSGISDSNFYYKPYVKGIVSYEIFSFSTGISRNIDYQISSGDGQYKDISINQLQAEADLYTFYNFFITAGFNYSSGDSDYQRFDYFATIGYEFKNFSLLVEYAKGYLDYSFDDSEVKSESSDYMIELSVYCSDIVSLDLGYTYSYFDSIEPDYNYHRHLARGGGMFMFNDPVFFMFGLSAGYDSSDYLIMGIDAALTIRIKEKLKLTLMNIYYYYYASDSGGKTVQSGDYTEEVSSSYYSNRIMAGVEYSFN